MSVHRFTFFIFDGCRVIHCLSIYNVFNQYPIGVHWVFLDIFLITMLRFLLVCLEDWFLEVEQLSQRVCTSFHGRENCQLELRKGFVSPLPSLSPICLGTFILFLFFTKDMNFLPYMGGKPLPLLILYLLVFFWCVLLCKTVSFSGSLTF